MQLPLLKNAEVEGKTVFLRADLDVPLSEVGSRKSEVGIEDDTRLKAALPTIEYLLKQNAKVIIAGKLGRPKGFDKSLSLKPVGKWFTEMLKQVQHDTDKTKLGEFDGWEIGANIFLLENLRFYEGEEKNDLGFSRKLASLADIYVNDAFAMCHRNHASIVGIAKILPHFAGFHLEKEVENLTRAMENPKRPLVVIIGGKKIETKLPLVEKMHRVADYVLVGGKIAGEGKELVKVQHEKIVGHKSVLFVADTNQDGSDITDKDAESFLQIISLAKTIIWNGPMGVINSKFKILASRRSGQNSKLNDTEHGTRLIAKGIIESGAYTIVGGGDTVEYLNKMGVLSKFSFASTGGGAMLAFLSGEKLPGIEVLLR